MTGLSGCGMFEAIFKLLRKTYLSPYRDADDYGLHDGFDLTAPVHDYLRLEPRERGNTVEIRTILHVGGSQDEFQHTPSQVGRVKLDGIT